MPKLTKEQTPGIEKRLDSHFRLARMDISNTQRKLVLSFLASELEQERKRAAGIVESKFGWIWLDKTRVADAIKEILNNE